MIRILDLIAPKHSGKEEELVGLTGLRGIAALMVFVYHLPWLAGFKDENWWSGVTGARWMNSCDAGVGLFFALSAFLLSRPFWQLIQSGQSIKGKVEPFLIRRFCRIFPAYWVVVAFSFLFDDRTWTGWGSVNLFLHALGFQTHFHQNFVWKVNNVLWTVSIEIQFYLLLALLFALAGRMAWLRRASGGMLLAIIAIGFLLANPLYGKCVQILAPHLPAPVFGMGDLSSDVYNWNVFYFLKWFLPGVVMGWISGVTGCHETEFVKKISQKGKIAAELATFSLIGLMAVIIYHAREAEWRLMVQWGWPLNSLVFALLVFMIPLSSIGRKFFNLQILRVFGVISYGLYLWHYPLLRSIGQGSLQGQFHGWPRLLAIGGLGLIVTSAVATISYLLVEKPAIRFGRHRHTFKQLIRESNSSPVNEATTLPQLGSA